MRKALLATSILLLSLSVGTALAQQTAGSAPGSAPAGTNDTSTAGNQMTVQGCLGGSAGNFTLLDQQGRTFLVTGDNSQLQPLVGHSVQISGTVAGGTSTTSNATAAAPSGANTGDQNTIAASSVTDMSSTCNTSSSQAAPSTGASASASGNMAANTSNQPSSSAGMESNQASTTTSTSTAPMSNDNQAAGGSAGVSTPAGAAGASASMPSTDSTGATASGPTGPGVTTSANGGQNVTGENAPQSASNARDNANALPEPSTSNNTAAANTMPSTSQSTASSAAAAPSAADQNASSSSPAAAPSSPPADQSAGSTSSAPSSSEQNAPNKNLPQTASPLPLLGLMGLGSLAGGLIARKKKK